MMRPALTTKLTVWQVEVVVKHHGTTWASSKEEAIANCKRDGFNGRIEALRYVARKKKH